MKSVVAHSGVLLWVLFGAFAIAAIVPVILALVYAPSYGLLDVPIASWFALGLSGLVLALDGIAIYFWRRLRKVDLELAGLRGEPIEDRIPAVYGHECLDRAEFVPIVQAIFRRPPDVEYVHVKRLPGGYGGSATVLAQLQREGTAHPWSRSFVIKLGDRREMADEHDRFHNHVLLHLARAAKFFRYAAWGDLAGVAYEFVGVEPDHEVQSLYQFYQGHAAVEVSEIVAEIYTHLSQAWYRGGVIEPVNLCHEYHLLGKKREHIISHVGEVVSEDDPYRTNFTAIEERLRPNLKPRFCPALDIPWYDPVAFLRTWPRPGLTVPVPVHRSTVHGDLHSRNVLVEIEGDGRRHAWFIDFSHTGNGLSEDRTRQALREGIPVEPGRGHTLRDFCRLEADVKFVLTRLQDEHDLRLAVTFERELMAGGLALADWSVAPPPVEPLADERFRKAWQAIREIRRRATAYLASADDPRPYYVSLLHATLPILYYQPEQFKSEACQQQQKRYALLSAGMLCSQL